MHSIRLAILAAGFLTLVCSFSVAADPPLAKPISLMEMLQEWQYPDSKFKGAELSDGGVSDIRSMRGKAILTTPDSIEKVLAFYQKKLNVDAEGNRIEQVEGPRGKSKRSVSIQNNSVGRPLKLYVICINDGATSTTLAISRAEKEAFTHVTWSTFRKLGP